MTTVEPRTFSFRLWVLLVIVIFAMQAIAASRNEAVFHRFTGHPKGDGALPFSGLIIDKTGNFYGTTLEGGNNQCRFDSSITGCGTVFELSPPSVKGGSWTETVLYNFAGGTDGNEPTGTLVSDSAGNFYGTARWGGKGNCQDGGFVGCGIVFQLMPPAVPGGSWTESVIYRFAGGGDGYWPTAGLILDSAGNLYGTTEEGGNSTCGAFGCGTVFELMPPAAPGGNWTKATIYSFVNAGDASNPTAPLTFDTAGNLYGTTGNGGTFGVGAVFELSPTLPQGWTESVLHSFTGGSDGDNPESELIIDAKGNLFGTALDGGVASCGIGLAGCGTVFELSPPLKPNGTWLETTLWQFMGGEDGANPYSPVVADTAGNLYGTTYSGGSTQACISGGNEGCGTVYKLTPPIGGGNTWTESVLYGFKGGKTDGADPSYNLIFGNGGALYGTTEEGGVFCPNGGGTGDGCGTIFAVRP